MDAICAGFNTALNAALRPYWSTAREIRLRAGKPVCVRDVGGVHMLAEYVSFPELQRLADVLCGRAIYAHQEAATQGYITLRGGHRMGLCGQVIMQRGQVWQVRQIGSVCIRVARDVPGAASRLYNIMMEDGKPVPMLLLGRPGSGKTTALRDLARHVSELGHAVCVADERGEIAACENGVPSLPVGPNTDVLPGMPKAAALQWLLRAMCPALLVADEMFGMRDVQAARQAVRAGVPLLSSAHAESLAAARRQAGLGVLLREGVFAKVAFLTEAGQPPQVLL